MSITLSAKEPGARTPLRFLAVQAFAAFHLADLALRRLPVRTLLGWAGRVRPGPERGGEAEQAAIDTIRRAGRSIRRFDVRARLDCLPRSLAVYYLLARRGVPVELCMGVRKQPFAAHAWVEARGEVVSDFDGESRAYVPIARVRPRGGAACR